MDYATKFSEGLKYGDFLAQFGNDEQRRRWQAFYDQVRLTDPQRQLLGSFRRSMKVLCLAGTWCGDCVNQCPIFEHFALATPGLDIRYFDRDAHGDLAAAVKVCGGARVPVVVFLSEDAQFCGLYGDKTLSRYRQQVASLDGPACPTGIGQADTNLVQSVTQDWLNEFERIQWMLRTSARLRQLHGD